MKRFSTKMEWILFLALAAFLLASLFIVDDYGMNTDSQKNFREGEMNLDYLLTGKVDDFILEWQMHGAYVFMAAEIAKRLLHDTLHLYDATPARHIIVPFMTAPFLAVLFYFTRRRLSALHGLVAAGLLLTFPYFWGHTFNNLKDVPLLIFFSLSLMSFVEWTATRRLRYLYGFFILWGGALAVKGYALLVPILLVLWTLARPRDRKPGIRMPRRRLIIHTLAGVSITAAIVCALYAPAFWGVEGKLSFLHAWRANVKQITWGHSTPFSLNPFVQVWFRTPVLVLIFAFVGLFKAVRGYRASPLYSLLLIWLVVPVVIPCFPRTLAYHNGMRHFMVFLVPFCILSSVGIVQSADFLAKRLGKDRRALAGGIASVTIGTSLWGVVTTHPYQTTFFNALAGGLKGAQEKKIPDAFDYWLNSYKEAGRWIDRFGAPNANVLALYAAGTPPFFNTDLIKDAVTRPDLKPYRSPGFPARDGEAVIPDNTYVLLVPFEELRAARPFLERPGRINKVHTISRQGGEICTIYYKPSMGLPRSR